MLLYEGKCKWSYGPSCTGDFPLNIFIHSIYLSVRAYLKNESRASPNFLCVLPMAAARSSSGGVKKGKSSPYSITERRVPERIPVLGS